MVDRYREVICGDISTQSFLSLHESDLEALLEFVEREAVGRERLKKVEAELAIALEELSSV